MYLIMKNKGEEYKELPYTGAGAASREKPKKVRFST